MTEGGNSHEHLEVGVRRLLSLMEPSYLEARTDTASAMRRLLFSGGIAVANADGKISEKEIEAFDKFLGEGAFNDSLNLDKLVDSLDGRVKSVRDSASMPQRMQVLRDLCTVARAEGNSRPEELAVLRRIADGLSIPRSFVEQCQMPGIELD